MGGSVGTSVSLDDFTRTLAMAYCQRVFQCCTVMNLDPESCQNEIVGQRELVVEGLRPFVASGKLTYRPDQAAACINGLLAASCTVVKAGSPTINTVTLCDEAFQSATAPGGDCTDDVQCIDGWCSPDTMKCVARKADGGTCDDDGDCLSDNCSPTTGTCVPRMVEGLCPV